MRLSQRIAQLQPSPTVALNAKANSLKAEGKQILNFAVGEPDFATPESIVDVSIKALQEGKTKYGPAGGGLPFRTAVTNKLKRENNLEFDPAHVVAGIGAKELLFHIFLSLLNEGDEVLVQAPYWVSYADQIKAAGGVPVVVPLPDDHSKLNSPEVLEPYCTNRTKVFLLNSPNNPAGYVLNQSQLENLGQWLRDKDYWIVSDEMYEYLSFETPHKSLLEVETSLKDRFILVHGLSKCFAMTGFRVGYAVGPADAMKMVKGLQSHSSTCLPPFIEAAATFALDQGEALMKPQIERLQSRRDMAVEAVREHKILDFFEPQGAFYLFIDCRRAMAKSKQGFMKDTMSLADHLLTEHQVAVVPGEAFGAPGFLRLSYATDEETVREGINRIGTPIEKATQES